MADSILAGLNLEATQQELLSEAVMLLNGIFEKMPRIDSADRVVTSGSEVTQPISIAASQTLATVTTLATLGAASRPADAIPMHVANIGSFHLYNQIIVS